MQLEFKLGNRAALGVGWNLLKYKHMLMRTLADQIGLLSSAGVHRVLDLGLISKIARRDCAVPLPRKV